MSDPAKYRTREEVDAVRTTRDPIEFVRVLITKHAEATTEGELKKIDACVKEVVLEAAEFAAATPEPALSELTTTSVGRPKLDIDKRRVRRPRRAKRTANPGGA